MITIQKTYIQITLKFEYMEDNNLYLIRTL